MDHWNCPVPSQVTWENNQSPLNEMHIHQQNHWNDILSYWYQSYHWYQWTIVSVCVIGHVWREFAPLYVQLSIL